MEKEFQATYEHGVLRLDTPLSLPEQARVTGLLKSVEPTALEPAPAQLSDDEFQRLLDEASIPSSPYGGTYSRADLYLDHD